MTLAASAPSSRRVLVTHGGIIAAYLGLTVLVTSPRALNVATAIPGGGDSWQSFWNLWCTTHALVGFLVFEQAAPPFPLSQVGMDDIIRYGAERLAPISRFVLNRHDAGLVVVRFQAAVGEQEIGQRGLHGTAVPGDRDRRSLSVAFFEIAVDRDGHPAPTSHGIVVPAEGRSPRDTWVTADIAGRS